MGKGIDANYKKFAYNSNNIIKIATILQKSLNNGKSSSVEMKEVGKYIMHYTRMNLEDCIKCLGQMIDNNNNSKDDRLNEIKHTLQRILQDVRCIPKAYEYMVGENGRVDKAMLMTLINIDNEMTSNLKLFNNYIASVKDTYMNENEIEELCFLAGEIELNIKERYELLKKLELKG
ncbi:MAG: hypothetical protein ACK4FV_02370 [Candidatus Nitrosocaldus sp.]